VPGFAATLGGQGKLDEAGSMEEVLEKIKSIFGQEHPHNISAMNNFAV
jgi:hypothetical protein